MAIHTTEDGKFSVSIWIHLADMFEERGHLVFEQKMRVDPQRDLQKGYEFVKHEHYEVFQ